MKTKLILAFAVASMLICSACIYLVPPETPAASGVEPNQAQESRAAEAKKFDSSSASLPDLTPTALEYDSAAVALGSTVYFDSSIRNTGSADSDGFNIKWLVNGSQEGYGGHPGVRAGKTDADSNSQFSWTPQETGIYKIEFIVDCDGFIDESNESNNIAAVTLTILPAASTSSNFDGPQIEGLVLQNGIYYYAENNRYNENPGDIAGYVKPNVFVNNRQTGAVCLKPVACLLVMSEAMGQIPNDQIKLKVMVPLDIAGFDGRVNINEATFYQSTGGDAHRMLVVQCDASVNILNTINHGTLTAGSFETQGGLMLRSVVSLDAYNDFRSDLAFKNIVISSDGTELKEFKRGTTTEYELLAYGELIAQKDRNSMIYLDFYAQDLPSTLTLDHLVTVDGYVVFITEYVW